MLNIPSALAGATLGNVRSTGVVHCGVIKEVTGFSFKNKAGRWEEDLVEALVAGIAGTGAVHAAGAEATGVVPVILEVAGSVASVVFVEAVASVVDEVKI